MSVELHVLRGTYIQNYISIFGADISVAVNICKGMQSREKMDLQGTVHGQR